MGGTGGDGPEAEHDDHAEDREEREQGVDDEVGGLVAEAVEVEAAAGPRHGVVGLLGDGREGGHADDRQAAVDDAAHRHPLAERDGHELGQEADGRQGEQVRRRLGEGEARPRRDADVAAEQGPGVVVVEVQVDRAPRTGPGARGRRPIDATSADQEKNGTRLIRRPGARVVSTVVATDVAPAARPRIIRPKAARYRSTMSRVAAAGATVVGQRDDHQDEAHQPGPEAGGGQAGEGQRAGADLQRHDGDGHARAGTGPSRRRRRPTRMAVNSCGERAGVEERAVAVDALETEQRAEHGAGDEGAGRHRRCTGGR